jgi:hypothetical protein
MQDQRHLDRSSECRFFNFATRCGTTRESAPTILSRMLYTEVPDYLAWRRLVFAGQV